MIDLLARQTLARVIAVINSKGGAGKTTVASNAGGLLAAAGYKVLVVDLDPQGNLADDLGYRESPTNDQGLALAQALTYGVALVPVAQVRPGLDVAPGGFHLHSAASALSTQASRDRDGAREILARILVPLAADYDFILLDCPPGSEPLQLVALSAARWALIPSKTDTSSVKGMSDVARRLDGVIDINPGLDLLGVILFAVDRRATRVQAQARAAIAAELGTDRKVFDASIRHAESTAHETRRRGVLVHELERMVAEGPQFWQILRGLRTDAPRVESAKSVADDFHHLTSEVIDRVDLAERDLTAAAAQTAQARA